MEVNTIKYIEPLRNFIVEQFLFGDGAVLKDDTSFTEAGIVDSTGILELITFIEEKWSIHIKDDELVGANFDSLNNIAGFLERKVSCAE